MKIYPSEVREWASAMVTAAWAIALMAWAVLAIRAAWLVYVAWVA